MVKENKGKGKSSAKKKERLQSNKPHETDSSSSTEHNKIIVQLPSFSMMDATVSIEKIGEYWEKKFSILKENLKLDEHENLKIIRSMGCPFSGLEGIEWVIQRPIELERNYKPKEKSHRYSIISYCSKGICKKNIIYGSDGKCIVQVDFEDHGTGGPHFHILIPGVLDHTSGTQGDHAFSWKICPWLWLAIPVGHGVNTSDNSFKLEEITLSTKSLATNRIEQSAYFFNEWCIKKIEQLLNTNEQRELLAKIFIFSYVMLAIYANDVIKAILLAIDNIENSGLGDEEHEIVVIKKIRAELEAINESSQNSRAASISGLVKPVISNSLPVPNDILPSKKSVVNFFGGLVNQEGNIIAIDECISQVANTKSKDRSEIIHRPINSSWPPLIPPITTAPSIIANRKLLREQVDSGENIRRRPSMRRPSTASFFAKRNDSNIKSEQIAEKDGLSREEIKDIIEMVRKNKENSSGSSTSYQP